MERTMSNLNKFKLSLAAAALLLGSCGGGGDGGGDGPGIEGPGENVVDNSGPRTYPNEPLSCDISEMRNWVDANMRDYYLFYADVPQVNLEEYDDLQTLIDDLAVQPFDRFSYITDAAQNTALFEDGELFGFGWRLIRSSQTDVRFGFVYPQSPIAAENVERGDYLLAINGVHPLDMTGNQWDEFLGTGEEVVTPELTILSKAGEERVISVTKEIFLLDTVLDSRVIDNGGSKTGYMAFTSFLETSNDEIDTAFEEFEDSGVTELVLDLRYNGGGRISVANKLASKIVGPELAGQIFAEISFNDKYSSENVEYNLVPPTFPLSLSRVVVLSTSSTCSASEMIINGLKPFIDVVQIGSTSCGKPYGSSPHEGCGKAMNALQFRFVNASGVGDYYEGIPADCAASDDTQYPLGDVQEEMLATALNYINNASCEIGMANGDVATRQVPVLPVVRSQDPLRAESNLY